MERTCELIKQAKEGNKEAQSILVEENSGLIWSVVKRFQGRGYDKEDLFQIGSIGLLKCIENFDLERNVKFSTYAVPLIMGEIKRFLRDDGIVKVSRSLKEASYKIKREKEHYQKLYNRYNEIKKELKEEVKRKLQIFTEKEEYLQYLIKTINDSLNVVNNDNSSIIFVTNNDKQKYEEVLNRYNIKIDVLDNDFIGGCKLKNDKLGVIIDNTLKTNLDEI